MTVRLLALTASVAIALAACSGDAGVDVDAEVDTDALAESVEDTVDDATDVAEDVAEDVADAAEDAADAVDENIDVSGEAETEVDASLARPEPDQDGDFGEFTFSGVAYVAVARSCLLTDGDDTVRTFEVVDGGTNNVLDVVLSTQNGADYGVEVYGALGGDEEAPIASGTATAESGDAERTNGEGEFADGSSFTFSLVTIGPPDC